MILFFPSAATTGNFTSSFEMEMSQTGFSAHTSKVSLSPVIYIWGFNNYPCWLKHFTVKPVNQTETLSHLQIMAEWPQAVHFMKEAFILRSGVCVREFLGRLLR